ncbi:MAG: DNA-deoxyinosine glycosylase [Lysobacter sp.]|nr:DNA-deoxyinosine glycosylase [Lysobacter sp.]MDQ3205312.1 DNA-deoxyinosine glycosylase [Pseudomonadota bacterium]
MSLLQSFPPLLGPAPRALILGSMPGAASLAARRYYAHPQNRFWPLMGALVGADPALEYPDRCRRLLDAGLAVWDVLAFCERAGSLDSAIRDDTAQPNDFATLFAQNPGIGAVMFNGSKAESSFRRFVVPILEHSGTDTSRLRMQRLPSTSPANASQSAQHKLAAWRAALEAAGIHTLG